MLENKNLILTSSSQSYKVINI